MLALTAAADLTAAVDRNAVADLIAPVDPNAVADLIAPVDRAEMADLIAPVDRTSEVDLIVPVDRTSAVDLIAPADRAEMADLIVQVDPIAGVGRSALVDQNVVDALNAAAARREVSDSQFSSPAQSAARRARSALVVRENVYQHRLAPQVEQPEPADYQVSPMVEHLVDLRRSEVSKEVSTVVVQVTVHHHCAALQARGIASVWKIHAPDSQRQDGYRLDLLSVSREADGSQLRSGATLEQPSSCHLARQVSDRDR